MYGALFRQLKLTMRLAGRRDKRESNRDEKCRRRRSGEGNAAPAVINTCKRRSMAGIVRGNAGFAVARERGGKDTAAHVTVTAPGV